MRKGTRTIHRICPCGCGKEIRPKINPKTHRIQCYPKYIPGHGHTAKQSRDAKAHIGKDHPNWKPVGTLYIRSDGYIKIKCDDGKWRYQHRVISGLSDCDNRHVHHEDGNPSNNNEGNLLIVDSSVHTRIHRTITTWSKQYNCCVICGGTERGHASHGRCTRCYQRITAKQLGYWPR